MDGRGTRRADTHGYSNPPILKTSVLTATGLVRILVPVGT
jgi:hypothetical protein